MKIKPTIFGGLSKTEWGFLTNVSMEFNLQSLIDIADDIDLDSLVLLFSVAEIENVIKIMPSDKAPGPDGFNGLFIKKCWPIISADIFRLFQDFFLGTVNLAPINGSYIVLIPKIGSLATTSDYRPISLLNCCVKMITKLLAERL